MTKCITMIKGLSALITRCLAVPRAVRRKPQCPWQAGTSTAHRGGDFSHLHRCYCFFLPAFSLQTFCFQLRNGTSVIWPTASSTGHASSRWPPCDWLSAPPSSCGATCRAWCSWRPPGAPPTSGWLSTRATTTTAPATPSTGRVSQSRPS